MADVFRALDDETRRRILDELAAGDGKTLFEICSLLTTRYGLSLTRQAISQHLGVLESAGLVLTERRGRSKFHYFNAGPLAEISRRWLTPAGTTLEPAEHPAVKPYRDALVEDGIPLEDPEPAAVHRSPAGGSSSPTTALPLGPFFHGTKADLRVGDLLTAGFRSNYRPEVVMNHIYFTALVDGAGLAAELATGEGAPHVYVVEPTGPFEDDPNVTDKKFPGNPTRSYRSAEPLRVVAELADWTRLTPEALQAWRDRLKVILSEVRGVIIN